MIQKILHFILLLILLSFNILCAKSYTLANNTKVDIVLLNDKIKNLYYIYNVLLRHSNMSNNTQWLSLLHYEGKKSLINKKSNFFISSNGYKNPIDEYIAFVSRIFFEELNNLYNTKNTFHTSINNDKSIICQYPARLTFIASNLYGLDRQKFLNIIHSKKCIGARVFKERVSFDSIFLEFAGESNVMPQSAMGHIYMTAGDYLEKNKYALEKYNQKFSLSFFATNLNFNPIDFIRVFSGIKGYVVLKPLDVVRDEYLNDEKRTLYRFKLMLNENEKILLRQHLWELKDKEIHYKIITYNCNTALRKILSVANNTFDIRNIKTIQTPTEYLYQLNKKGLIKQEEIILPKNKKNFVKKYGQNDVLNTKKNSRLAFYYAGFMQSNTHMPNIFQHHLKLDISPIYLDGRNADTSYKEFMESKLFAFSVGIDSITLKPYIDKLEFLKLKSVLDFIQTKSLSKLFNITFESNIYQPSDNKTFLNLPNTSSLIMPTIEFGIGFGAYIKNFKFYMIPIIGYRYDKINNIYIALESGVITSFQWMKHDFKGILNYTYFYDFMANNRGYDNMLYGYFSMALLKNLDIFIESKYYSIFLPQNKINYLQTQTLQYNVGLSWYF